MAVTQERIGQVAREILERYVDLDETSSFSFDELDKIDGISLLHDLEEGFDIKDLPESFLNDVHDLNALVGKLDIVLPQRYVRVFHEVRSIAAQNLEVKPGKIARQTHFIDHLGADSLHRTAMYAGLKARFSGIEPGVLCDAENAGDLSDTIADIALEEAMNNAMTHDIA